MSQRDFHKSRPLCPLCRKRPAEIRGYSKGGEPSYRGRCAKCRGVVRAVHGLPARRGKEGRPGVPRCPGCRHVLVKFCPHCGRPLGGNATCTPSVRGAAGPAGDADDKEDRKLDEGGAATVLREVSERRGRVSFVEFLAIAERLHYDQAGAEALLVAHPQRGPEQGPEARAALRRKSYLRRVKDDVELTRDGYDLLTSIGLRPPYFLLPMRGPQRNE